MVISSDLKSYTFLLLLIPSLLFCQSSGRIKSSINQGWKFQLGNPEAAYYEKDLDDSKWEVVHVPHTLELTSMSLNDVQDDKYQKTFMRKVGWYRKELEIGPDSSKKIFLEFEGVHQVTDLWVNGKHVGQHAVGGYTPFHFDISNYVNYGETNQITLLADNRRREDVPPDPGPMDFIKFGGLYRDVYLVETNPLHITFNWESEASGQFITIPTVDPVNMNGTINIKTYVRNEHANSRNVTVVNRVVDHRGIVVLKLKTTKEIAPGSEEVFNLIGSIEDDLKLWSIDNPYLYRVNTQVFDGAEIADEVECKTGFRKIEITDKDGVLLNGKPIKLIGTNRHQHYGFIGDAMPNSLHYKDVLQLKELGMNVLRTAHYPQDNAVIEACDELGILVYEEPPTWMSIGSDAWFDNFEKAARAMVRNHRNHPSIFIWGAGINHRGYVPRAHNIIKQEDPFRFTASQSSRWTGWQTSGLTDIYGQMVYGPYYWSEDEPVLAMEGRRGPRAVNEYMHNPMKLGLISWTAHAYYTFHHSNNPKDRSRSGFTTVFRYPRPEEGLPWYKAELTEFPYVKIQTEWEEGTKEVMVYSNCEAVELFANGKSLGIQTPAKRDEYKYLKHAPFHFPISKFEPGTLQAKGITEGKVTVTEEVMSPESAYKITLELDSKGRDFIADGSDIMLGYAKIVDRNGTLISDANTMVKFEVKGPGGIVGDQKNIGANPMPAQYGVAPFLLRAAIEAGNIVVTAKAKGLKSASVSIQTKEVAKKEPDPIYDFDKIRVDLGELEQLVQFDWIPWSSEDRKASTKRFEQLGGFEASISCPSAADKTRWLGEINVMGKYGFAHGEGVLGNSAEGLLLEFSGLKKGKYKIQTFHHAPRTNTDNMDPNQEKISTYEIYKIPYAKSIDIHLSDARGTSVTSDVQVTEGKDMQTATFGAAELIFESDGKNVVKLIFKDGDKKAVWLNSFVLSEWF